MHDKQLIRPPWPWAEKYRIAQGVRVGGTVYVSGQVAYRPDGSIAGTEQLVRSKGTSLTPEQSAVARQDAMRLQARQVFANIDEVLRLGGATMRDIVKLNAYLTDFDLFPPYAEVRRGIFPEASFASTGVEVARLVHEDLLLEVEVVAHVGV